MGIHFGGRWVRAENFKPEHTGLFGFDLVAQSVNSNGFCQSAVFFWMKEDFRRPWHTGGRHGAPRHSTSLTYKLNPSSLHRLSNET